MRNDERKIYFYDIEVGTNKKAASPPPLITEIAEVLVKRCEESIESQTPKALHSINNDTAFLEIRDARVDYEKGFATLLLRNSDQTAPDAFFSNPLKGTSRPARKRKGEGRDYAAHLLIRLEPSSPNNYLALLERNTGLHASHVKRLLQAVLKQQYQEDPATFQCHDDSGAKDKHGNPKIVSFRPMLELRGHPSDSFISDLENGTLQEILLVHDEQNVQLGGQNWLRKSEQVVRVKPKSVPSTGLWPKLKSALKGQSSKGFEKARIQFKRSDGEVKSVELATSTGAALDDYYIKSVKITDIWPVLDDSSDAIVDHLANRMEGLLFG